MLAVDGDVAFKRDERGAFVRRKTQREISRVVHGQRRQGVVSDHRHPFCFGQVDGDFTCGSCAVVAQLHIYDFALSSGHVGSESFWTDVKDAFRFSAIVPDAEVGFGSKVAGGFQLDFLVIVALGQLGAVDGINKVAGFQATKVQRHEVDGTTFRSGDNGNLDVVQFQVALVPHADGCCLGLVLGHCTQDVTVDNDGHAWDVEFVVDSSTVVADMT